MAEAAVSASRAPSAPPGLLSVRASIAQSLIWRRLSESAEAAEVVCDDPDWASLLRLDMRDGWCRAVCGPPRPPAHLAYKQWPSSRARLEGQQLVAEYRGSCLAHALGWHPLLATPVATASDGNAHVCSLMSFGGESLANFIRSDEWRTTPLAARVPLTLEMLACLMTALDLLHQRGYLHRDIKPLNVLYSRSTRLFRLIDFGLLCRVDLSDFSAGFSRAYLPVEFTAPAAAVAGGGGTAGDSDAGMRAVTTPALDVFLATLTAFEMLQGDLDELPDANFFDLWLGHDSYLAAYRDFFSSLAGDSPLLAGLPGEVVQLLLAGLAVEPAHRPSAAAVLALPVMANAAAAVRSRVADAAPAWTAEQQQLRAFGLALQSQTEAEGLPGVRVLVADAAGLEQQSSLAVAGLLAGVVPAADERGDAADSQRELGEAAAGGGNSLPAAAGGGNSLPAAAGGGNSLPAAAGSSSTSRKRLAVAGPVAVPAAKSMKRLFVQVVRQGLEQ